MHQAQVLGPADRVEAGILPNPSFSYGTQLLAAGVNTGSAVVHELSLEQPLLIFGQRGVRRGLAFRLARGLEDGSAWVRRMRKERANG